MQIVRRRGRRGELSSARGDSASRQYRVRFANIATSHHVHVHNRTTHYTPPHTHRQNNIHHFCPLLPPFQPSTRRVVV
eukprot:8398876-Pyramimonas_sp.AAC.1